MGPRFDSQLGHKELRIYLAPVCLVIVTGKVSGEGDVQSVTIWWQGWYKCVGVIDQTGKSSFGLFTHLLISGFWFRFSAGSQRIVNIFGAGMLRDYYW